MPKNLIIFWSIAAIISYFLTSMVNFYQLIYPLIFSVLIIFFIRILRVKYISYLLFFSISFASLLGLTQSLTGSHAEISNIYLYGLSFYTASIAYLLAKGQLSTSKALNVSNPLLLSTGPIALFVRPSFHKKLTERIKYYFPFVLVGLFMFQVVASPLTEFFFLLDRIDAASSIVFAIIFEIFVYMNFCGLSLAIYGLFGVIGYRIPLNFKQPFSSSNIVEFWRGWHVSLSEVLKVLFYKPIRNKFSLPVALLGVYLASAMWHGVTLNFFIWGTFHALMFWITILLFKQNMFKLAFIILPFAIVVGRLIFADSDSTRLLEKLSFNFTNFDGVKLLIGAPITSIISLLLGLGIVLTEFIFRNTSIMQKRNYKYLRTPLMLVLITFIGLLLISDVGIDYAVYGQR
jgi:alginate O-acetyltransferase complex protein AlgI